MRVLLIGGLIKANGCIVLFPVVYLKMTEIIGFSYVSNITIITKRQCFKYELFIPRKYSFNAYFCLNVYFTLLFRHCFLSSYGLLFFSIHISTYKYLVPKNV